MHPAELADACFKVQTWLAAAKRSERRGMRSLGPPTTAVRQNAQTEVKALSASANSLKLQSVVVRSTEWPSRLIAALEQAVVFDKYSGCHVHTGLVVQEGMEQKQLSAHADAHIKQNSPPRGMLRSHLEACSFWLHQALRHCLCNPCCQLLSSVTICTFDLQVVL
eukprot:GHRR01025963.1.p1 GENE.GHRR01025963.1~~GHRR01025963.1.p1  ORF type:complete len:165 (+),score=10.09 GHRR01025963.1:169-663(+)